MKIGEVKTIFEFLSKVNLTKFEKEVRLDILKIYADLYPTYKDIESKIEELKNKVFSKDDLESIQKSYTTKSTLPKDILNKNSEYLIVLNSLLDDDCDIVTNKISEADFTSCLSNSNIDYTPLDIIKLKPILK